MFLIDAQVNDYEEVQCDPRNATQCVGKITAHITAAEEGVGREDSCWRASVVAALGRTVNDGRTVNVRFPAYSLSTTVRGEGMPMKGGGKGDLVVHLFCNLAELAAAARNWGRILYYIAMTWLFLTNPTIAIFLFMGMNALRAQG